MSPEELARIHAASFTTPRPWSAQEFAYLLDQRFNFLLDEPGAFLLGRVVADEAELLTLAVAPEARRRGAGARLVRTFLAAAQDRSAVSAFLEVAADNEAARALYRQTGWRESGLRKGYYQSPENARIDAVVMSYALDPATT